MKALTTSIPDVILLEPEVIHDDRGFFMEYFNSCRFAEITGRQPAFVQDNQSHSRQHVLRGLHYQIQRPQAKLVRVISGTVFDVVVDMRRSSPTFGQWQGTLLSAENRRMLWVPEGFAHGFLVLSDSADCIYKVTDYYFPEYQRSLLWSDPDLAIDWPLAGNSPQLSHRDATASPFKRVETFA